MAEARLFVYVLIFLLSVSFINSERILGIFITPSVSHLLIHLSIADELSKAGHDVTILTPYQNPLKNTTYNYIDLSNGKPHEVSHVIQELMHDKRSTILHAYDVYAYANMATEKELNNPILKKFLAEHGPGSFDLLLLGYFFNDVQLGLGAHFRVPIIISWMVQITPDLDDLVGNPHELSYVPNLQVGMRQPLSFLDRVGNVIFEICRTLIVSYLDKRTLQIYEKQFPADRYASLEEVKRNVSLIFVNHHFSQKPLRPLVPAVVEIGGIQIQENPEPLPKDLADIFEKSENGVIYFSLGSNVEATFLSDERVQTIYNVFSQLPYTFIWRWRNRALPGTAKNIYYREWLPQTSLLSHPKLKLFITHAGGGGVVEAQYFGKPILAMPLFGDQFTHANNAAGNGFAVVVDFHTFTEQTFKNAIMEVLNNPVYKQNVEQFSKIYRDRPLTPRQSVRFWTEYVLRHQGAKHMQSPAVHMNFIQLHCLDVFAFLLLILVLALYVPIKACQYLCKTNQHQKVKVNKLKKK